MGCVWAVISLLLPPDSSLCLGLETWSKAQLCQTVGFLHIFKNLFTYCFEKQLPPCPTCLSGGIFKGAVLPVELVVPLLGPVCSRGAGEQWWLR